MISLESIMLISRENLQDASGVLNIFLQNKKYRWNGEEIKKE